MDSNKTDPEGTILWPNTHEIPDGVVPFSEVSQNPEDFDDSDLDREMED